MCRRRRIGRFEYRTLIANSLVYVKEQFERKALATIYSVGGARDSYRFKDKRCCKPNLYVLNKLSPGANRPVGAA